MRGREGFESFIIIVFLSLTEACGQISLRSSLRWCNSEGRASKLSKSSTIRPHLSPTSSSASTTPKSLHFRRIHFRWPVISINSSPLRLDWSPEDRLPRNSPTSNHQRSIAGSLCSSIVTCLPKPRAEWIRGLKMWILLVLESIMRSKLRPLRGSSKKSRHTLSCWRKKGSQWIDISTLEVRRVGRRQVPLNVRTSN